MIKPPVVPARRACCARSGAPITGEEWVWLADGAGQRLYHPPDVSGWDDKRWLDSNTIRARWDLVNYVVAGRTIDPGSAAGAHLPGRDARAGARRRARVLARPAAGAGDGRLAARATRAQFQPPADTRAPRRTRASSAPAARPAPERPPSPDRRLGRLPDLLMPDPTSTACGCAGFSRSELLRGGAATAGRGLRAIEAGMPLPAGTGLSRRSFLARSAGSRWPSSAARALGPRAFEDGHRRRRRRPARTACSSRSSARAAWTRCRCWRPSATRATRRCAARSRCRPTPRTRSPRTRRLRWHPNAAPLRDLHAAGQADRDPGDRLRRPQPVALHLAPLLGGRRVDPAGRVGWLGRYLDRHGAADNPLQGLSLDYTLAPVAGDRRRAGRRRLGARVLRPVDARRLGRRDARRRRSTRWGGQGALATADPELATARRAAGHEHGAARAARRAAGPHGRLAGRRRLPGSPSTRSRTGSPRWPR